MPEVSLKTWNGLRSTREDWYGPKELGVEIEQIDLPLGVACKSTATYPKDTLGSEVICDQYRIRKLGNRMIMVVCDGCGWGVKPREAAKLACEVYILIFTFFTFFLFFF